MYSDELQHVINIQCQHKHSLSTASEWSWDSLVGIANGYELDSWGSIPGRGKRFCTLLSRLATRSIQPTKWVTGAYFVLKQPGHKADHSPPSSA
jgi:hypothetical protein